MIYAYPRAPSVCQGRAVTLHVATSAPKFRVDFYRQGASLEHVGTSGPGWGRASRSGR